MLALDLAVPGGSPLTSTHGRAPSSCSGFVAAPRARRCIACLRVRRHFPPAIPRPDLPSFFPTSPGDAGFLAPVKKDWFVPVPFVPSVANLGLNSHKRLKKHKSDQSSFLTCPYSGTSSMPGMKIRSCLGPPTSKQDRADLESFQIWLLPDAPRNCKSQKPSWPVTPSSVETTQIYTHVMQKPGLGVRSPLNGLAM